MQPFLSRRFLPFWVTLFCGALNDNLFKTGFVLFVAFQVAGGDLLTVKHRRRFSSCPFACSRAWPDNSPTSTTRPASPT